jgi:hypothetical protein
LVVGNQDGSGDGLVGLQLRYLTDLSICSLNLAQEEEQELVTEVTGCREEAAVLGCWRGF